MFLKFSCAQCALLLGALILQADPACRSCHPAQAGTQPKTPMASALLPAGQNSALREHPKLELRESGFHYLVQHNGQNDSYSVSRGADTLTLPIRWTFGAKSQTYVLEHEGKLYESRVSYYPEIPGLDLTIGDQDTHPRNVVEAMGRELSAFEARSCFECHATHATSGDKIQMDSLVPGVQCARCHSGGAEHQASIANGKAGPLPPKLGALPAEDISNLCGSCHRTFADVVRNRLFGVINVRFQPYRLAKSKCYNGADRRIGCTACHDPHQELVRDDASYDRGCKTCHSLPAAKTTPLCKVATSACVSCHMPKVNLPGAHHTFTDHFIRVARPGEAYPD